MAYIGAVIEMIVNPAATVLYAAVNCCFHDIVDMTDASVANPINNMAQMSAYQ